LWVALLSFVCVFFFFSSTLRLFRCCYIMLGKEITGKVCLFKSRWNDRKLILPSARATNIYISTTHSYSRPLLHDDVRRVTATRFDLGGRLQGRHFKIPIAVTNLSVSLKTPCRHEGTGPCKMFVLSPCELCAIFLQTTTQGCHTM